MKNKKFDPSGVGIPNGNYFGFPYTPDESNILLVSVPWDVTTSYNAGSSQGPKAILEASTQLDFFDPEIPNAWEFGIGTDPVSDEILTKSIWLRSEAEKVINHLERGGSASDLAVREALSEVNRGSEEINDWLYEKCRAAIDSEKLVGVVGGDHSVPLGLIKALSEKHNEFGILQIDAHADLREAYEGFENSHASIMYNAMNLESVKKIVHVGIRDICDEEATLAEENEKLIIEYDYKLKENSFIGISWFEQCRRIISKLPGKVYISFDIDGLDQALCPNTGTPVPGGLSFNEAVFLIKSVVESGKKIIGFDLCEVAPGEDEWDANVGARLLYKLSNLMYLSHQNI
ncbi:MAG: agmatinase family protein [Melioribacteraceae bacterium]|nr:agmatinase family protein [Melioribacteraceae bacterium]